MENLQTLRSIAFIVGIFLLLFGLAMLIPAITNNYLGYEWKNFLVGFIVTCTFSAIFILLGKLNKLHGMPAIFAITSCTWIALSLFAAIPFYLDSLSYIDALFEAVSGITTTGATVLSDIEQQSPGILLWRAMLHGIGGFGVITIGIAAFPIFKVLSLNNLLYSEYSDAIKRRLPHTRSVVIHIAEIYYGLILLCIFSYYLAGMPLFDAICHGMSAVSTGGFANYNDSIGHYNNSMLEVITIIFMILGSLPFLSYLKIIRQLDVYHDEQVSCFIKILIISSLFAYFWLYKNFNLGAFLSFRYSTFTITSFITSTGYVMCNYLDWSFISVLAFFLTFIGGCSGSASGGIKIFRLIIFLRSIRNYFSSLFNPGANDRVKFNGKILKNDEVQSVFTFFAIYILTFTVSSIVMSYLSNADFVTSISSVSAMLTNSGPGFSNLIGPSGNYSSFSGGVKLFLSFLMLLGRLEILPIYFCIGSLLLLSRKN
ncbi:cation transport protein [Wolbachia endosymbiont of Armadillidium vulgare str. wVulC]|uniref:TrkH family potassium uptake protein n=1 Tax=Wolbachia endosymbiont of Armadillidium arcangelii TaxID=3158571 RepID=A0AAU7Q393_9RICK|nr:TrkH family potassium uptake protein [Wolbachia endosymbiont of Armadillidium vulgare]KLT22824.1 cation transport protein [Wolbachia endosymbiont of Armadillidium vulgare str. wVulC]OJH31698.1 Trk system potassium uptake protein TrkG [Wolbachia endosymbiont of Armadillidium vulgare]OJH32107.1 Trk system potassium uptake protein TrkG [Wolbachia endosymbiont of Armadillidium vulgare]OJH32664.1 Trk system potassium uptake protein TrkG [Wolbachia endosymbiont of Armadillidium vulgare]OJH33286.1